MSLTPYYKVMTFEAPKEKAFWKKLLEKKKMVVISIFSFFPQRWTNLMF